MGSENSLWATVDRTEMRWEFTSPIPITAKLVSCYLQKTLLLHNFVYNNSRVFKAVGKSYINAPFDIFCL